MEASKDFQYIKDLDYVYRADIGLSYSSPCRGAWNIVHYGTLVPEGHQIYVCPVSCLRGVVLTTAEMGFEAMKKLSGRYQRLKGHYPSMKAASSSSFGSPAINCIIR